MKYFFTYLPSLIATLSPTMTVDIDWRYFNTKQTRRHPLSTRLNSIHPVCSVLNHNVVTSSVGLRHCRHLGNGYCWPKGYGCREVASDARFCISHLTWIFLGISPPPPCVKVAELHSLKPSTSDILRVICLHTADLGRRFGSRLPSVGVYNDMGIVDLFRSNGKLLNVR